LYGSCTGCRLVPWNTKQNAPGYRLGALFYYSELIVYYIIMSVQNFYILKLCNFFCNFFCSSFAKIPILCGFYRIGLRVQVPSLAPNQKPHERSKTALSCGFSVLFYFTFVLYFILKYAIFDIYATFYATFFDLPVKYTYNYLHQKLQVYFYFLATYFRQPTFENFNKYGAVRSTAPLFYSFPLRNFIKFSPAIPVSAYPPSLST
jgi:hypothetical protein